MPRRKERPALTWLYDTREKRAYDLAVPDEKLFSDGGSLDIALNDGDISCWLDGEAVSVMIERKALNDFLTCCGRDRPRFENELARLAAYHVAHIIIEAPYAQIRAGSRYSVKDGLSAWHSIAKWETVYPTVHFHPCTNRTEAQMWTRTLLQMSAKEHWIFRGQEAIGE